jgi:hypothetical protein
MSETHTTYTSSNNEALTLDGLLDMKRKWDELTKPILLTLGEHTVNLMDYEQRSDLWLEGRILLTNIKRTKIQQWEDPLPTDVILIDPQLNNVWFLGDSSYAKFGAHATRL